ncbi:hypothetical protein [Nitrososphaera sp.]|uniref:hypothetical protein n=1 Tax=Nitrososphaera sp. TaxID=1971748 RepID=UPI00307FA0B9
MEMGPATRSILANLHGTHGASLAQIKMWLVPQKAEHEHDYDINRGYFEMLADLALRELMQGGYVQSTLPDGMEDGDAQVFSLTEKGTSYLEQLVAQQQSQAAASADRYY